MIRGRKAAILTATLACVLLASSTPVDAAKKYSCRKLIHRLQIVIMVGGLATFGSIPYWYPHWSAYHARSIEKAKLTAIQNQVVEATSATKAVNALLELRLTKRINAPIPESVYRLGTPEEWATIFMNEFNKNWRIVPMNKTNASVAFAAQSPASADQVIQSLDLVSELADGLNSSTPWKSISAKDRTSLHTILVAFEMIPLTFARFVQNTNVMASNKLSPENKARLQALVTPQQPLRGVGDPVRAAKFEALIWKINSLPIAAKN